MIKYLITSDNKKNKLVFLSLIFVIKYFFILIKFELDKKHFAILHKSSKKNNTFQLSYFDNNNEAYSDKEFNNLIDAVHYIYVGHKLIQVL